MIKIPGWVVAGVLGLIIGGVFSFLFLVQGFSYGECLETKGMIDPKTNGLVDPEGACENEKRVNMLWIVLNSPAIPAFILISKYRWLNVELGYLDGDMILIGLSWFLTGIGIYFLVRKIKRKFAKSS